MNPAAERILGWRQAEIEGRILHDVVHYKRPDGRPFPMQECPLGQVLLAAQPVLGMADQWIRKDGTFVPLVTTGVPLLKGDAVVGAVLSMHDDTERRRAEAERERLLEAEHAARTEAEAANRAKTEFLAVMSHELRTPLNAIGGYTELLDMGIHGPVTEAQRTALHRIQASQRHLLGLINEVLNYAKLETGAVRYDLEDVSVQEMLSGVAGLVEPQARVRPCPHDRHVPAGAARPRRRGEAAADPGEPAQQRDQIHRARRTYRRDVRADRRTRPLCGPRHGDRDRCRQAGDDFRALRAGTVGPHADSGGHRSGSRHQPRSRTRNGG